MEVIYLKQKQRAVRWHLNEATLERWRSEGIGPKFMKLNPREYAGVGVIRQEKTPAENGWGFNIGGAAETPQDAQGEPPGGRVNLYSP